MAEIPGIETIRGLAGDPPQQIPIHRETMVKQQHLIHEWNPVFIATIPFCYKCKVPLVWHSPPDEKVLFHCPECGRQWIKDEDWNNPKEGETK